MNRGETRAITKSSVRGDRITEFPFAAARLRFLRLKPTAAAVGYLLPLLRSYLPPFSKTDLCPRHIFFIQGLCDSKVSGSLWSGARLDAAPRVWQRNRQNAEEVLPTCSLEGCATWRHTSSVAARFRGGVNGRYGMSASDRGK